MFVHLVPYYNFGVLKLHGLKLFDIPALFVSVRLKGIYFAIYGIISEFTDKGQFQYLTNLKGSQEVTYLYTTQFLSLR